VLKLAAPLTLDATVQAAILPKHLKIKDFTWVLSSGWGVANYEGPGTSRLQTIIVPIVSNKKCVALYGEEFDAEHQLCLSEEARASCQGDSGSALIWDQTVVGVITYTADCPDMPTPTRYTRVQCYVEWIKGFMK
jgi:secreted trypsin-like serine protease